MKDEAMWWVSLDQQSNKNVKSMHNIYSDAVTWELSKMEEKCGFSSVYPKHPGKNSW